MSDPERQQAAREAEERAAYQQRDAEKARLWDALAARATSVTFPHPNGRVVVERRGSLEPIGAVLERVVRAIARS